MILRPLFPDQLTESLPSLCGLEPHRDIIVLSERGWSLSDRPHHPKKLIFLIAAQRHFAQLWREKGFTVVIQAWDAPEVVSDLGQFIAQLLAQEGSCVEGIVLTQPSTAGCQKDVAEWGERFACSVAVLQDDRFYCTQEQFDTWAQGRKSLRMEYFYRMMRTQENILIQEDGQPEGGAWNYDAQNRKLAKDCPPLNQPYKQVADVITQEVIAMLKGSLGYENFGSYEYFHYSVTRQGALEALEMFVGERLALFGDFQDVMRDDDPWLYHSHISLYINSGLLVARECVDKVLAAYYAGQAPLNATEGFIRQILGWREFVRGVYGYYQHCPQPMNTLEAHRPLPALFWGGPTKMNCLRNCIADTEKQAYAHHIQRLMVIGNFSLLAGLSPQEVDLWFLVVYADAFEWVQQPNVLGMSLFADGGIFASKPYAASGSYINKMSNYCQNCYYSVKEKEGDKACPFHSLYWDFIKREEGRFRNNPRMAMIYRTLDRLGPEKVALYQRQAQAFLTELEYGTPL